jgi:TonB family protein
MSEAWKQWQGQVVDGKFPLRQYLGGSEYSAVFATERREPTQKAAIKFIQLDEGEAETQLSRWKRAAQLSHPHLLRVFEHGRCRLGDFNLLYAVMEYAEENLAQFLPQRPLTPAEAREVLIPTLEGLAYLHSEGVVHGHVRPSNILAIADCLKLSTDSILLVAEPTTVQAEDGSRVFPAGSRQPTIYDAPEIGNGGISPAADIWSLGMTLVEMLTQRLPVVDLNSLPSVRPQDPQLPDTLPALFLDIARHCLHRDPLRRWTIGEISARLNPGTPATSKAVPDRRATPEDAPAATGVKRAATSPQPTEQAVAAAKIPVHAPVAPGRPPRPAQTVAARDPLTKARYDLAPPHLKRPPLMPKFNYLVLGIVAALVFTAILVGPRILNHRAPADQAHAVDSSETTPKSVQSSTHAKNQAKTAQKTIAPATTPRPQPSQPTAQSASLPPATHNRQDGSSQPVSQTKVGATSAPTALRAEAAPVTRSSNSGVKSSAVAAPGEVLSQVLPEPSQKAQATIHGKVRVGVKVQVDATGNVTGAEFASPGPSKYFADLALRAARRWDFAPAKVDGHAVPSEWLIVFHFTPSGPKVFPTESNP